MLTLIANTILSVLGTIATLIGKALKALYDDVVDLFTSRRFVLAAVLVAGGAWLSADYFGEKIRELQKNLESTTEALEEERKLNNSWQARYDDETKRAAEAEKAREEAADAIRHAAMQAAAEDAARKRAAAARRLREQQGSTDKAGSAEPAKSGVFSLQNLPWASK